MEHVVLAVFDGIALAHGFIRIFAFDAFAIEAGTIAVGVLVFAMDAFFGIFTITVGGGRIGTFLSCNAYAIVTHFIHIAWCVSEVVIDALFDGIAEAGGAKGVIAVYAFAIFANQAAA